MRISTLLLASSLAVLSAASAQTVLTVASWKGGGSELAAFPELIAKFEQENPGVSVQLQYASRGDHTTAMNTKIQAGEAPDVIMVDASLMRVWADAGVIAELTQEAWVNTLRPDVRDFIEVGGQTYMFPMELIGEGVFVNTGLLKEAGVTDIPLTLGDYKAACAALQEVGATPLLLPALGGWTPGLWSLVLGVDEAQRTNPAFVQDVAAQNVSFTDTPAFTEALTSLAELADAGCYDPRLNLGIDPWSTGLDEFRAGRVAFLPQGAWNIQSFRQNEALEFQFAPFPALSGTEGTATNFVGTSWAVNAQAANPELARTFVSFWAEADNLEPFLQAEGASSPLQGGVSGLPDLAAPFVAAEQGGRVFLSPEGYWSGDLMNSFFESMSSFLLDVTQSPAATLERWDVAARK